MLILKKKTANEKSMRNYSVFKELIYQSNATQTYMAGGSISIHESEIVCKYRILGECLLISSLPGNALRTSVDITIQHAFSKLSLVNSISKDANLITKLIHSSN